MLRPGTARGGADDGQRAAEGIALILGVDRLLDMARTVPSVTGDLLTSLLVSRWEGSS